MKRFVQFTILISVILTLTNIQAKACGYSAYSPSQYFMYRVYDEKAKDVREHELRMRNCAAWKELAASDNRDSHRDFSLEDIYEVLYTFTYKDMDREYNSFLSYLSNYYPQALECILLAKRTEELRENITSPWYYPTMNIGDGATTLQDVVETALSCKDNDLRPRYLIQAMRALFTLEQWRKCWELWEGECSKWKDGDVLKDIVEPYARGAAYRLGYIEESEAYFANTEDIESIFYCHKVSGSGYDAVIDKLVFIYKYAPSSPALAKILNDFIFNKELYGFNSRRDESNPVQKLINFALRVVDEGKTDNPAMWLYTASFLTMEGLAKDYEAAKLIARAKRAKGTEYIHESIRVLAMYLDAATSRYDSAYEARLLDDLKWIDKKIDNNITEEIKENLDKLNSYQSFYYWNDMMRRVVLGVAAPGMLECGKVIKALQLANYGSNKLRLLLDEIQGEYMTSTAFFEMIDSVKVDYAVRYVNGVHVKSNPLSDFLNERSYLGQNYLNDIVGTLMLRNRRYAEADKYLSRVNSAIDGFFNVQDYYKYDPFSLDRKSIKAGWDYRKQFAKRMHSLEKEIKAAHNSNVKGKLMAEFAIGMRQSFSDCWPLTLYSYSTVTEYANSTESLRKTGIKEAGIIMDRALNIITDDEVAARINYSICRFGTVAKEYPDTFTGGYVRGHCDEPYNYDWLKSSLYFGE